MAGLNQASLIGNVGGDPEIRTTTGGTKVATFSLATSEQWKDRQSGEKKEHTEWHRIVVWGNRDGSAGLAGIVEQYVRKGSKLFVQGQIKTRQWEGTDNVKHYTTEIVLSGFAAQLVLLDSANRRAPGVESQDEYTGGQQPPARSMREEMDDEIPF